MYVALIRTIAINVLRSKVANFLTKPSVCVCIHVENICSSYVKP